MSLLLASTSHYIGIALDIAVVLLLLTFAFIGYHHGFFKSLLGLFSTLVVLILSFYFANHFAKLINTIYDFTSLIARNLSPAIEKISSVYALTFPSGMSGSSFYNSYIASSSTNTVLKKFFQYILKGYSAENIEGLKVADVLAGGISSLIMTVIAGILLFILIKIALALLSRFFDNITKIKVFGGLNKIFGFVFGACKGAIVILFFIIIAICASFVPKINKKIYPLINKETTIVKTFYNTTDTLLEKYFIKTDVISKWVNNLWDNRDLDKKSSIADQALVIDNEDFNANFDSSYTLNLEGQVLTTSNLYFRINQLNELESFDKVSIMIFLTYTSTESVNLQLYDINELETTITKDDTSSAILITYSNITYDDFILSLNTTNGQIITDINFTISGVTE